MVESSLHPLQDSGMEDEDCAWMGLTARGFTFVVRRMDDTDFDGKE